MNGLYLTYMILGSACVIPLYLLGKEDRKNLSITYRQSFFALLYFCICYIALAFVDWQTALLSLILGVFTMYMIKRHTNLLAEADIEVFGALLMAVFPIAIIALLIYFLRSIYRSYINRGRRIRRVYPAFYALYTSYVVALLVFLFLIL